MDAARRDRPALRMCTGAQATYNFQRWPPVGCPNHRPTDTAAAGWETEAPRDVEGFISPRTRTPRSMPAARPRPCGRAATAPYGRLPLTKTREAGDASNAAQPGGM